jgi:hypothetical protein
MRLIKRTLIFVHRWLGVALCILFLLWFPSGIVMMYWQYPEVTAQDRLEHSPALVASTIRLTPGEAFAKLDADPPPTGVRLDTLDGRPVYEFRNGRDQITLFADTGEVPPDEVTPELMLREAARWSGRPASEARVEEVKEVDQWTIANFRNASPITKYSWPDGQQVYVSGNSGDVVQATTTASRTWAYLGAIPHWFYFTPLRKNGPTWSRVVIWSSGIGTGAALLGMVIAVWMYSPSKRYRYEGAPTSIPYRGQKRLHTIFGLIFGMGAVTWAFSGMLSMEPFPLSRGGEEGPSLPQFRGLVRFADIAAHDPRTVLAQLPPGFVKSLEYTSFDGTPMYLASLSGGETRVIPLHGTSQPEFDRNRIMEMVRRQPGRFQPVEVSVLDHYDRYYLDRLRRSPLPVILARYSDPQQTRIYIDPKTARVVTGYQSGDWMERWLYHGLHSLNFPWLYNYRPLWDIVVITFMAGGTALCVTSLILAWRVLGRKLKALLPGPAGPTLTDDLIG